jgi:hypothetical protein
VREAPQVFEGELAAWDEKVEEVRRTNKRLGPLAAERAKQYEHITLEQVITHWARVTSRRGGCEFESIDNLEVELMAITSVLGVKMRERVKALGVGGFDYGEPMQ